MCLNYLFDPSLDAKGQLNSEWIYWVHRFSQNANQKLPGFPPWKFIWGLGRNSEFNWPLASKEGSNNKKYDKLLQLL